MTFSERLHISRELLRCSLRVLWRHPRLLLFPFVSMMATLLLTLIYFAPLLALFVDRGWTTMARWAELVEGFNESSIAAMDAFMQSERGTYYFCGALVYVAMIHVVSLITATFFNVAFYSEILRALAGAPVSLRGGFRFALRRWRAILQWSLLAGSVGVLIQAIEARLGWIGRIVTALLGASWSVAAAFAIPVIIRRTDASPLAVLRDSAATLKRAWGESVVGFLGIQMGSVTLMLVTALFGGGLGLAMVWTFHVAVGLTFIALALAVVFATGFLSSMATHVYRCALYVYASEGVVPGDYTAAMMDTGWKVRKG